MNNYIPTQSEKPTFEQDPRNEASFKRTMGRACMLRPEQLRRVTVDVFAAIRTVRAGASAVQQIRERLAKELPLYDFLPLDQIEDTCRALLVAHERYINESDERATEQPKHEAQAIEIRRIAIGDLTSLAARGVIPAEEVAKIRPRSNRDELLLDLNAIDRLLTLARQKLGERLWVTVEEQEYLRATATALSETVLVSTDDGKAARARIDTRMRVFTQLVLDYDTIRRVGYFAFWPTEEADKLVPSIFARGERDKPAREEDEDGKDGPKPGPQPQSRTNAIDAMPQHDLDPNGIAPQDDPYTNG